MQAIKYHPLSSYDDDDSLSLEYHSEHNNSSSQYIREYRTYWLIIVIFICFIIINGIYLINNFETLIQWLKDHSEPDFNYNQTDILIENFTSQYGGESVTTKPDNLYKFISTKRNIIIPYSTSSSNDITTTNISQYDISYIATTDDSYIISNNDVSTVASNYIFYKTTTSTFYKDDDRGGTMANENKNNDYEHVDLTTMKTTIDLRNNTTATTKSFNLNSKNKNTYNKSIDTSIAKYLNDTIITSTLLPIPNVTKITTDFPTTSTTTQTIVAKRLTSPSLKTVKHSLSVNDSKYFINTSHCHIPFVEPLTPEIRKIFKPKHYTGCTKDEPIITVSFNESSAQYQLHINYTVAENFAKPITKPIKYLIEENVLCCYQEIIRSGSGAKVDSSFKLLPCTNFHQDFVVPFHINGIIVKCKSKSTNSILQEDAFSFIQINKTLMEQRSTNNISGRRKPSVLMIGIDTLSRMNFRRNMPETFKYLSANKWYELFGYNKVGDNTLPNLMPLLSGYTRTTTYAKCSPTKVGGLDNCNFIWTTFKNNGYQTAYAEDLSSISTFNYHLKGFKNPPTDYYFHPMSLAIERSMKKKLKAGLSYCVGRKQYGEYIYDYGTEFVTRYKNVSSFGLFWTNSFSHNSYDVSATMDKTMLNYFKEWQKRGIFENSVVMFFSDHGVRWGPLLKLSQGYLEERLPMFFISLPKWFQQEYPDLVKNLEINQRRLANPFDINMTLQHLLKLGEPNYKEQQTYDCPNCQSIFKEIPENRTCEDASIPETWCTCLTFKKESTKSDEVKTIAELIIQEMNAYYEHKNLTSICSPLELKQITNAKMRYTDDFKSSNNITTYAIDFATYPLTEPSTLFSATVDYVKHNNSIHLNVEDISRQSLYENTAKCTDDKQAKKYCICKNSLKSETKI